MFTIKKLPSFIAAIIICELAGIFGTIFTLSAIPTWYASLTKPFFSPPNAIFGPVWTVLYLLMGLSLAIIWNSKGKQKKEALIIFFTQLGLNILWSMIFFGLRNPVAAFLEILLLWLAIFSTIRHFYKIAKLASYLLYPYLAWVSFAGILNLFIWLLNQ